MPGESGASFQLYISVSLLTCITPSKSDIEPENHPVEKENHLPNLHFLGSMLVFRGVIENWVVVSNNVYIFTPRLGEMISF